MGVRENKWEEPAEALEYNLEKQFVRAAIVRTDWMSRFRGSYDVTVM
jgi:hypothetical protein